ncbi:VWA domain-containing protein [Accumulibacter sp.]|uniref:VWA domain-containing protein n=1 Tax=Accumulibacter sp. TaxID=2053492 RepID=UPI00261700C5|nr:VWA domain-containing protein [Accumulibacter sp.]
MSDSARLPPPLLGLFRELLANGVPLGVRDYLDALRALQLGFGRLDLKQDGRQALRDLALALWARSDAEQRLIARWFDLVPAPGRALIDAIDEALARVSASGAGQSVGQRQGGTAPAGGKLAGPASPTAQPPPDAAPVEESCARVSFVGAHAGGGLPVPRLSVEPKIDEHYVLHPHTLVSLREMTVLWRRYRRSTRRGPRRELDLAATIRERCRRGRLLQPVCRARRANSARLLVLADTSASMDPWRPFLATLADSLRLGRLASAELRYFSNLPRSQLFADVDLTDPQARDEVLRRHAGAGLLVLSDAGSARGYLNRRRALQTAAFLAEAASLFPAIVWINPMPRTRWAGTTAALVAAGANVSMLPLDAAHLLRAVDILRGNK